MERGLIRAKWQVTIPRGIRRRLNLFLGQTLNWELTEEESGVEIRIITGYACHRLEDMAAFQEIGAKKARKEKARKKRQASAGFFRISDAKTRSILGEMIRDVTRAIVRDEMKDEPKP